jgi:hypothetical protein
VICFHDGDRVVIVASKLGLPQHPAWFHNLKSNPLVRLGGRPFRAEVITDDAERARLGDLADRVFPAVCHLLRSCRRRWSGYPDRLPPPE